MIGVSPEIGLAGILFLFGLLVAGMPIGIALAVVGFGGSVLVLGLEPAVIKSAIILFETLSRYELGTLPLFLLVAHLVFSSNASKDIFDAAAAFMGHRRGGLAAASVGGCAGFSAINGSSLATVATIGLVALPEMRKRGYSDQLATGAIAAGGTLGPMIPPSGALIVFGIVAEQSIGTLFTAAIIPGLTQMLFYFLVIWLIAIFRPEMAPASERISWPDRWVALRKVIDILLLVVVMISGIVVGWFTPTEAASVGVMGALLISAMRRRLTWHNLSDALLQTLRTSGMIYLIVIGALIFAVFISVTGFADAIAQLVGELSVSNFMKMVLIAVILLLLGSVLDGLALMLLTTPILLPVVRDMGYSPIWFGIFLVRAIEIGFIHPPIGMNLYIIQGIAKNITLGKVFRGVLPFLASDLVHLLLIISFPAIALWLPHILGS